MQTAHIVNSTYYEWNVGPLVGKWVTGELQNNGLALVANTSAGYYGSRTFASREISDSDPSKVPILRITYQEP
jgi:hypothetical protein